MFSKILKEKRKELGLTQQEVADHLNVTRQTISNWEVGKSYPDIPTLVEISNFYNLSLDYMLKGDERFMEKVKKDTKQLDRYKTIMKIICYAILIITFFYFAGHEIGKAWYYFTN
ncbi:helix-turn-helix transcriptional regulator [Vagococcus carniphilus]|uniref:Helix-turn-helix transcriptional regulator n=1 Tax=Vagococcus carniphilus TaxID=218144 RepID=A0AAW8U488_9ENTE|nr:helix-turn-helix transcriptional regulator [Vagococcus carniphilus]MDT2830209.1 helix-turn-helix transcriptional regulator [Vagococcus carniphilus]MDT2833894.1 helix-turn-helix transcriptional regulator [Vagococcus carniphilus]MDT2838641.1 helix-turn-helix transcriptional regulator [Vagococcus carniphilus]MDT2853479.1 helix-turn-helix transcriptional regulator [Vagococcus carniphilus]